MEVLVASSCCRETALSRTVVSRRWEIQPKRDIESSASHSLNVCVLPLSCLARSPPAVDFSNGSKRQFETRHARCLTTLRTQSVLEMLRGRARSIPFEVVEHRPHAPSGSPGLRGAAMGMGVVGHLHNLCQLASGGIGLGYLAGRQGKRAEHSRWAGLVACLMVRQAKSEKEKDKQLSRTKREARAAVPVWDRRELRSSHCAGGSVVFRQGYGRRQG